MSNTDETVSLIHFFMLAEGQEFATMAEKILYAFKKSRTEFNDKIIASIYDMRDTHKLVDVKVQMLSTRQRLLEDSHTLLDTLTDLRKKYRIQKGKAYDNIVNNIQLRMKTTGEKEAIVEGTSEIAELRNKIEILENQTQYYTESIRTVDGILYGIRTRLEIEKLLGV